MAHFFQISGITNENKNKIIEKMSEVDGMRKILTPDVGAILFMSDSGIEHEIIKRRVESVIENTGAWVLSANCV